MASKRILFGSCIALFSLALWAPVASQPNQNQFSLYQHFENALLCDQFTKYVLLETFFPKVGMQPICTPVNYRLLNCTDQVCYADNCCNCPDFGTSFYNVSFLWTKYNVDNAIGPLLLSSAWSGIVVRGFDWETNCLISGGIELVLRVGKLSFDQAEPLLDETLQGLTAVVGGGMTYVISSVCACD